MLILKKKWLRDKANLVLKIVDSPVSRYAYWDVKEALDDRFPLYSERTRQAIYEETFNIQKG